jgi:hypothetical protein
LGLSVLGIPSSLVNCDEAIHRIIRHAQTGYIKVEIHNMEIYFPQIMKVILVVEKSYT